MKRRAFLATVGGAGGALLPALAWGEKGASIDLSAINAGVLAENCYVSVFLNGAPFFLSGRLAPVLFAGPVHELLQNGRNRLDFLYEPFNMTERKFTPHEGVRLELNLSIFGGREVSVLNTRYSESDQAMVADERSLLTGQPRLTDDGVIRAGSDFTTQPAVIQFSRDVSGQYTRRLSTEFQINMSGLGKVSWAETAELNSDFEIRDELYLAYQTLHGILQKKDMDGFIRLAQPWLLRLARMNGYSDERSVAERVFELSPMGGGAESEMAPLMSREEFQSSTLRWGSTGQLVASFSDQIRYLDKETGKRTGGMRVFFARQSGEELRIYYSLDNGQ